MSYNYNPQPPRAWSRVQNACSTINDSNNNSNNSLVYSYFSNQYVTTEVYEREKQMLQKGNILQYKKNSSNLTKNQRFSKIAKGQWTNRTKSWATQSQTYSNPNTSSLLRVNYSRIPVPSNAVLSLDCSANFIKDGGNLICNKVADPCTDVVIKTTNNVRCYSTSDSDVPGPLEELCWNNGIQTWYPRQNLTMNNSANKWPEGYKGFVSAVSPGAPYLMVDVSGNTATLSWKIIFNSCLPVNSFNIYQDGQFIANVPYPTTSYNVSIDCGNNYFYVTAVSGVNESGPSNYVNAIKPSTFLVTGGYTTSYNPLTEFYTVTFNSSGTIQFLCQDNSNNQISGILIGGGGGGSGGSNTPNTVKGGGGGGGAQTIIFTTNNYTNGIIYNINIGTGGNGGPPGTPSTIPPDNGDNGVASSVFIYTALGGQGGQGSQGGDGGGSGLNGGGVSEPGSIPPYSNGNGGVGINSGNLYGGGGGGGGANGGGGAPDVSLNVAGGGGGGVAYNISTSLITTAGGGGGGGTPGGTGFAGGIGGQLYGGTGANSNGSNGSIGTYGGGGGGGSGAQNNTTAPNYGAGYGGNGGNGCCILKFKLTY